MFTEQHKAARIAELERDGEARVRAKLESGSYMHPSVLPIVREWLHKKELGRKDTLLRKIAIGLITTLMGAAAIWSITHWWGVLMR